MSAYIKSTWNTNRAEETKVNFSEEWKQLSDLDKLDNLKDTLLELTDKYNQLLETWLQNDKS